MNHPTYAELMQNDGWPEHLIPSQIPTCPPGTPQIIIRQTAWGTCRAIWLMTEREYNDYAAGVYGAIELEPEGHP